MQLDHPITISASQHDAGITDLREVEITFGPRHALVKRDLRALGIEAPVPWKGAFEQLFGKHYEVVGRLLANFNFPEHTYCAAAQFWLDRIYSTPE